MQNFDVGYRRPREERGKMIFETSRSAAVSRIFVLSLFFFLILAFSWEKISYLKYFLIFIWFVLCVLCVSINDLVVIDKDRRVIFFKVYFLGFEKNKKLFSFDEIKEVRVDSGNLNKARCWRIYICFYEAGCQMINELYSKISADRQSSQIKKFMGI